MSTVESFVGGVGRLLAQNVSQCKEKIERQRLLCLQDKERIVQMLVRKAVCFKNHCWSNSGLWVRIFLS